MNTFVWLTGPHPVRCEEAKRACFKILSKTPEGDIKSLITKLQSIEAYPDKEIAVKPVVIREACGTCNYKGHTPKDCWGKCQYCSRYGHKSQLCRNKKTNEEIEIAKRAKENKKKDKKKKKKKEEANKAVELVYVLVYVTSSTSTLSIQHHAHVATTFYVDVYVLSKYI